MKTAGLLPCHPLSPKRMKKSGDMAKPVSAANTASRTATGVTKPPRREHLAVFVHILDTGFIEQQIRLTGAVYFEAALVVPLDRAVERFPVTQNKNHRRLGLHLFYVIKIIGVGLIWRHRFL